MKLVDELAKRGLTVSMAHARKLIHQGGIRVDGKIIRDNIELEGGEKITLRKAKGCTDLHKTTQSR
jgi:ribosomal protein S4